MLEEVIQTASCRQNFMMRGTFGADQFSFGTIEPLRSAISRVRRAVKSARGSSFSCPSKTVGSSLSFTTGSISDSRLVVFLA